MVSMSRCLCLLIVLFGCNYICSAEPLAGTKRLDWEGDIASRLIDSADAFLLKKIEETLKREEEERVAKNVIDDICRRLDNISSQVLIADD